MILKVRIISPKEDIFVGEAQSVSSVNRAGPFDVLPQHAKFVTLVEDKPIVLRLPSGEKRSFSFPLAIVHVRENQVDIYINPTESFPGLSV